MTWTWAAALKWRLGRHFLDGERAASVEAVVDRLVAVPAWSGDAGTAIRLRLATAMPSEPVNALETGRIIATYAFRGSTHLMTPASASVHLALRSAGRQWERASWREYYDLEPEDWPRLRAAVRDALRDGPLTQHDLARAVTRDPAYRHLQAAFDDKSHTFLKPFGWQGDLCFGRSDGSPTFRLLDSVPGWEGIAELEAAGPRAIRDYLSAYGPTTRDRIDYWLVEGLSAGKQRVARWVEQLGDELTTVSIEGVEALCLAEHTDAIEETAESELVTLLPGSDQWILGAGTADTTIVPATHRRIATLGANLALIGGRMSGSWRVTDDGLRIEWLDGIRPPHRRAVEVAVDELSRGLGRDLEFAA